VAGTCGSGAADASAGADAGAEPGDDGGATKDGGPEGGNGGRDGSVATGATSRSSGGCGCALADEDPASQWGLLGAAMLAAALVGRRARRVQRA
jgi:MYXO-CTERM domain-containing protein